MLGQSRSQLRRQLWGYNLATGADVEVSSPITAALQGMGLAGSAAALDTHVRIMVGQEEVGDMFNASTGAVTRDAMFGVGALIPAGTEIMVIVDDAAASNPINGALDLQRAG